jgi:hypothetical protein
MEIRIRDNERIGQNPHRRQYSHLGILKRSEHFAEGTILRYE